MVHGIEKYKEHFKNQIGKYSFIGGSACDILLSNEGAEFRATKDLDIVLLLEVIDKEYIVSFSEFIKQGQYEHIKKGSNEAQFYRFEKPTNTEYPYMIELFSKKPEYIKSIETHLAPIHISEEVQSLSAILLDDDYYELLREGTVEVNGVSVLKMEYIILFKIKAWLDLSMRRENGESIDSRDVKKHKNDIFRLLVHIPTEDKIFVGEKVMKDINEFLIKVKEEPINLRTLGIRGLEYSKALELIKDTYL